MTTATMLQKFGNGSIALPRIVLQSPPLRIAAFVVAASLMITGMSLFEASAPATSLQYVARAGGASAATASTAFSTSTTPAHTPMHEVHIANNGLMFVRGATVTSIDHTAIVVSIVWSGATFNWQINTDSNTKFITTTGEKGTLSTIQAGDYIDVTGMLTQGGTTPTIAAQFIRE